MVKVLLCYRVIFTESTKSLKYFQLLRTKQEDTSKRKINILQVEQQVIRRFIFDIHLKSAVKCKISFHK